MKLASLIVAIAAAVFSTGCTVIRNPHSLEFAGLGQRIESGYTARSGAFVSNRYNDLWLEAKIVVMGNGKFSNFRSSEAGGSVLAESPCIVLGNDSVVVLVKWKDVQGRVVGTASRAFQGLGYEPGAWRREWAPVQGEHDGNWNSW